MVFTGDVRALDLDDLTALAGAYAVECEATTATRPGWVPLGQTARIAAWRADHGWTRRLVGAFEQDTLVGFAMTSTAHDTPDTSWVDVAVRPGHQRRGIGSRLVEAAESTSPGRVARFVASAYRPERTEIAELERGFAQPLGYSRATTETVVELDLLAAKLPPAPAREGYRVMTYLDGVPAGLRQPVGVIKGLVDAEAPHGELAWQPTPVSVEAYQDEVALWREQGRTVIESVAVIDEVVAAWTCLLVAADPERPAQVEGTLVRTEHRGRGLGRAVKTASLVAAREHGRATRVRTSSDDQNVWMQAINDALGFVPVESEIVLHRQR